MWIYTQISGQLAHDGASIVHGYSGHGEGRNNPAMQAVHAVGPIPQGEWIIAGPPVDTAKHGPYVLHLFPKPGTETFGRDGFLIHGDSMEHPGGASEGCLVFPRPTRELMWASGDRELSVISGLLGVVAG